MSIGWKTGEKLAKSGQRTGPGGKDSRSTSKGITNCNGQKEAHNDQFQYLDRCFHKNLMSSIRDI